MVFQYAVFANSRSYGSRSFSSLIAVGSAVRVVRWRVGASPPSGPAGSPAPPQARAAGLLWSCAISTSGMTSASMTLSDDFERSWLRSSRTVS